MTEIEPLADDRTEAEKYRHSLGYDELAVASSGKRCGVQWDPWMGDWFTSWSPRNSNSNAEGPWDHWVDLAIEILRDPLTALVRPEVHAIVVHADLRPLDLYDQTAREVTDDELMQRFRKPEVPNVDQ